GRRRGAGRRSCRSITASPTPSSTVLSAACATSSAAPGTAPGTVTRFATMTSLTSPGHRARRTLTRSTPGRDRWTGRTTRVSPLTYPLPEVLHERQRNQTADRRDFGGERRNLRHPPARSLARGSWRRNPPGDEQRRQAHPAIGNRLLGRASR